MPTFLEAIFGARRHIAEPAESSQGWDLVRLLFSAINDRFGSKVSLSATSILRQLSGVEQTESDESGPSPADLPLSGVLLSWPVASVIVSC